MSLKHGNESLEEIFIFETSQQLDSLEECVINTESAGTYSDEEINEIFRIMHTIKSSAAMMSLENISKVSHIAEDLFYFIRESKPNNIEISSLSDLLFRVVDFMKSELEKIKNGNEADGDNGFLIKEINEYIKLLKENNIKNLYKAIIKFEEGCGMENIRAFSIIHKLQEIDCDFKHLPKHIDDDNSSDIIRKDGLQIYIRTHNNYNFIEEFLLESDFLDSLNLLYVENEEECNLIYDDNSQCKNINKNEIYEDNTSEKNKPTKNDSKQGLLSVSVKKIDDLMDLVGEMVIAESMVTRNKDLINLPLHNFNKAARHLRKITEDIKEIVMSIRMVPLQNTFLKMNRIVRDMSKKLNKEVNLVLIGEDTEVDKNIIEYIADPIMHLVRNALDHGIENEEERISKGKNKSGTITLEAKNMENEVSITIKDDGRGLNKDKILSKAIKNGLISNENKDISSKDIFNLIFLPGFSTRESVTEFSGRGVGMDVVTNNINSVGGSIHVESYENEGTKIIIKIPLTLAIISAMNITVGESCYAIPVYSIKESFKVKKDQIFSDLNDNEMIMIRGKCYPVLRLHKLYKIKTDVTDIDRGIIIMVQNEHKTTCLLVDSIIGEQQIVVKDLPQYIKNIKNITGISGCTLLGDGSVSLILNINELLQ